METFDDSLIVYCHHPLTNYDACWHDFIDCVYVMCNMCAISQVALLVVRRTNNQKVVDSMPANVVCITVMTGSRLGVTWPATTPS